MDLENNNQVHDDQTQTIPSVDSNNIEQPILTPVNEDVAPIEPQVLTNTENQQDTSFASIPPTMNFDNTNTSQVDVNDSTNPNQMNIDDNTTKKPKKKLLIPIVIAACVFIFAIIGFIGYQSLFSQKKVVEREIKTFIKGTTQTIDSFLTNFAVYDTKTSYNSFKGNLTIDSDYNSDGVNLANLKNYKLSYSGLVDSNNDETLIQALLLRNDSSLFDIKFLSKSEKTYISLGDLYEKTIVTDFDSSFLNTDIDKSKQIDAYRTLIHKIEPVITNYFEKHESTSQKVDIEENGKKKNYTKVTYNINVADFVKNILENSVNDNDIINSLSVLSNEKPDKIKQTLNDAIKDIDTDSDEVIIISMYLSSFATVADRIEISSQYSYEYLEDFEITNDSYDYKFSEDKIVLIRNGEQYTYKVYTDDTELYNGVIKSDEFTLNSVDNEYKIQIKYTENSFSGNFIMKDSYNDLRLDFQSTNKDAKVNTEVNVSYKDEYDSISFHIHNDLEYLNDISIEKIDTQNAISVEDISDEDYDAIYELLLEKINNIGNDLITSQYRMEDNEESTLFSAFQSLGLLGNEINE